MAEATLFDLDHPRSTRVTPNEADTGTHIHIHADRDRDGTETDSVWIANLGYGVDLMWSQWYDAGGYAIRMKRSKARRMALAILDQLGPAPAGVPEDGEPR